MSSIIAIRGLTKVYATGFEALKGIDLDIRQGEIFALLGPNGAGKTTLISIICGIVRKSAGQVLIAGHDNVTEARAARALIGLVPQELTVDAFESVEATVTFSRGLFAKPPAPEVIERVLKDLSLWDRRASRIMTLSGGMKRRVLIAKALSHEPAILFLDEPTAGVDVALRREMWVVVRKLKEQGVTIILTTHYLEEAEEMADRVGVMSKGRLIIVEETATLMRKLGRKELTLELLAPIADIPASLRAFGLILGEGGQELTYSYEKNAERAGISALLSALVEAGIGFRDLRTSQSSLEDIFVDLVKERS